MNVIPFRRSVKSPTCVNERIDALMVMLKSDPSDVTAEASGSEVLVSIRGVTAHLHPQEAVNFAEELADALLDATEENSNQELKRALFVVGSAFIAASKSL